MDQFHLYNQIGQTGTVRGSTVYKTRRKQTIEYFAARSVPIKHYDAVCAEVAILHELDHPCIIKLHHWYRTRNNVWLVLDFCSGGDLRTILKADGFLPEATARTFASDVAGGLHYLNSLGIVHNQLRPAGVLLGSDSHLRLSDLSHATRIEMPPCAPIEPDSIYTAPELRARSSDSFSSDLWSADLWSLGVLIVEMCLGLPPEGTELSEDTQLPASASEQLIEAIRVLLQRRGEARSWQAVLGCAFWTEDLLSRTADVQLPDTPHQLSPQPAAAEEEVNSELEEEAADDQPITQRSQPDAAESEFEVSVENLTIPDRLLSADEAVTAAGDRTMSTAAGDRPLSPASSAPAALCELVWQSEELRTCPIFQNPQIEMIKRSPRVEWGALAAIVGAQRLQAGEGVKSCDVSALVSSIGRVLLAPSESVARRLNVLAMIEVSVCVDTESVGAAIEAGLAHQLLQAMQEATVGSLKLRLVSVIALLVRCSRTAGRVSVIVQVRHASTLPKSLLLESADGSSLGLLAALTQLVRQPPRALAAQLGGATKATAKLHSRTVAALCEVVFCMGAQPKLLTSACGTLVWVLRAKGEPLAQQYVCALLANVFGRRGPYPLLELLDGQQLLERLIGLCNSAATAAAGAVSAARLCRACPALCGLAVSCSGVSVAIKMLEQHPLAASTLLAAMLSSDSVGPASGTLGSRGFEQLIAGLAAPAQPVAVRCKLLLALSFLISHSSRWLVLSVKQQLVQHVDKMMRERAQYPTKCVQHLVVSITKSAPRLSAAAVAALGANSSKPANTLQTLLALASRPWGRSVVMCRSVVDDLASCVALCDPAQFEPTRTVLQCCEAVVSQLLNSSETIQKAVLKALLLPMTSMVFRIPAGEVQWLGLKVLCDALFGAAQAIEAGNTALQQAVCECGRAVVPQLGMLLTENDPSVGIKLASAVLQCDPTLIEEIHSLVHYFVEFFDLESPCNNKHNLRIVQVLVASTAHVSTEELIQLGVVPKLVSILKFACSNRVESYWELLLQTVVSFAARADEQFLAANCDVWPQMRALASLVHEAEMLEDSMPLKALVAQTIVSLNQLSSDLDLVGDVTQ